MDLLPAPIARAKKAQILVVDDDPINVALLERHLSTAGYPVLTAGNGVEALKIFAAQSPRILILDWIMPGLDGPAVCRMVRSIKISGIVHVIMLTVHSTKQRLVEAFDAGVDDFLSKPFDGDELLARIRAGERTLALQDELAKRVRHARRLNARLERANAKLDQLAHTDELTGLLNRRQAVIKLKEHWEMSERYDLPLSVLMMDLDDFKKLNDQYGHGVGDAVLRDVGGILGRAVRSTDSACRVGGEEFLILLPNQPAADAARAAERYRRLVSAQPVPLADPKLTVTLSIGVAERHCGMANYEALLSTADGALYAAKGLGKDRSYVARNDAAFADPSSSPQAGKAACEASTNAA